MMNPKTIARDWCPPILWKWASASKRKNKPLFENGYTCWADAQRASTGYDSTKIFERVKDASMKVRRGEAVFDRDSVCFYEADYRWPILACLLSVAAKRGRRLSVLDFGGGLGSFYFQHKKFLAELEHVHWSVVEQKHFVQYGRKEIQDETLRFYDSVRDCLDEGSVDVVFISSVLQYLEFPYAIFETIAETKARYLLIDRTPFIDEPEDRLTVQHVPASIYAASYPAWFLSRNRFQAAFADAGYHVIATCPSAEDLGVGKIVGIFLERNISGS